MAIAAAMAPTAVVPTITADTAMPTMKRCQLDSRLAAVPARDSKEFATPVASTAIGCVTAFETKLPRTLTSLPPL